MVIVILTLYLTISTIFVVEMCLTLTLTFRFFHHQIVHDTLNLLRRVEDRVFSRGSADLYQGQKFGLPNLQKQTTAVKLKT